MIIWFAKLVLSFYLKASTNFLARVNKYKYENRLIKSSAKPTYLTTIMLSFLPSLYICIFLTHT